MKRIVCLLVVLCLLVMGIPSLAAEYDMKLVLECDSESVEVGDQFLVTFKLTDVKSYLTFQLNGKFDCEYAEIIAPVYENRVIGILENSFDNESGVFKFVGYDQTIRGTDESVICSVLFKAKKAGAFNITMTSTDVSTMVGKADENAFYNIELEDKTIKIGEDKDGNQTSIIEDTKPLTPYDDMLYYDWAEKAVGVMYELGALQDIAYESFYPGENITRGDFITMLVRVCKLKSSAKAEPFGDVSEDSYQYDEIMIAKALGIAMGGEDGNFRPDEFITRQDICALVYRTMKKMNKVNPEIDTDKYLTKFSDSSTIASYAVEPVAGLIRAKIIIGDDTGLLRPSDNMTRAEAAVLLNRLAEYNVLISR